ncbi:hypothetical protein [Thermospira aquatica]|uniref:Outer membrane protein beta-barrel domain-containing protein n=1 Tax=Thermospira aquatica TaxID=2828656 RepID=A0AAX3BF50_9SPIR|nr:hypothetical protein [Thermospira aquatica]URA10704.1 hypothetical protein KDW03_02560 [Thermospira aquatica]
MRIRTIVVGVILASGIYGLSLGGEACFFVPEGGLPSLEFSAWQESKLFSGLFWELGGMYYRIFGIGVQGRYEVRPVFSGDMVAGMLTVGWEMRVAQWETALRVMGGWGYLFDLELRESEMRRFFLDEGWGSPVVVERASGNGVGLMGWGVSLSTGYQWRRFRVGFVGGWMDLGGEGDVHLYWKEFHGGTLDSYEEEKRLQFLLRGLRIGGAIRVLL